MLQKMGFASAASEFSKYWASDCILWSLVTRTLWWAETQASQSQSLQFKQKEEAGLLSSQEVQKRFTFSCFRCSFPRFSNTNWLSRKPATPFGGTKNSWPQVGHFSLGIETDEELVVVEGTFSCCCSAKRSSKHFKQNEWRQGKSLGLVSTGGFLQSPHSMYTESSSRSSDLSEAATEFASLMV